MIKSHEWFENKVHDYHEDKVTLLSRYNAPRQIQRQEAIERDRQKDRYCQSHGIPLYRMNVPFYGAKKWDYKDYYRYINTELKFIVNLVHGGESNA